MPDFVAESMRGKMVRSPCLLGAPTLIMFHHYAKCAVCNERIHELRQELPRIQAETGLQALFVCHSDRNRLLTEFGDARLPFDVIPDPTRRLYALFCVIRSVQLATRSLAFGTIPGGAGSEPSGMNPADVFVDADGDIVAAHYGEFLGDTWSVDTIRRLAETYSSRVAANE